MRQISRRQSIDEDRRRLIASVGILPLAASAPAWGAPLPGDDGPDPRGATVTPRVRILTRWYRTGMTWRPVNALIVSGGSTRLLADPMPSEAGVRALLDAAGPAPALLLLPDRPGARDAIACATALGVPARIAAAPEEIDLGGALVRVRETLELDVDVDATRLRFGGGAGRGGSGWFVPFSGQPRWLGPSASSI